MKKILLISVFIIISFPLAASSGWYIGVDTGYSYSLPDASSGWPDTIIGSSHGYSLSIPVEYRVNDNFAILTGLGFRMKSLEYEKIHVSGGFLEDEKREVIDDYWKMYHYIEVPLTFRVYQGNSYFRAFIGAGIYFGVRVFDVYSGRARSSTILDYNGGMEMVDFTQIIPLSSDANLFDVGVLVEAGVSFSLTPRLELFLKGSYRYDFLSLEKNDASGTRTYFTLFDASLGLVTRL